MPDINFNLDLDVFNVFALIGWDCSVQVKDVCQAGTGVVSLNCGQPSQGGYLGKCGVTKADMSCLIYRGVYHTILYVTVLLIQAASKTPAPEIFPPTSKIWDPVPLLRNESPFAKAEVRPDLSDAVL